MWKLRAPVACTTPCHVIGIGNPSLLDLTLLNIYRLSHLPSLMHATRSYISRPEWPLNQHHTHQIMTERPGDSESFTRAHIGDCMAKVVAVDLHQTVTVGVLLRPQGLVAGFGCFPSFQEGSRVQSHGLSGPHHQNTRRSRWVCSGGPRFRVSSRCVQRGSGLDPGTNRDSH